MKTIIVDQNGNNKNLITYLTNLFPSLNINSIYKALRKKDIKLNGIRINKNLTLHLNDKLEIYIIDSELYGVDLREIRRIYEDSNIVVFYKPANLEVLGEFSLTSIMQKNIIF